MQTSKLYDEELLTEMKLYISSFFFCRAPTVIVKVGPSLSYEIGVLSYASPNIMHGLSRNALFGVIAGKWTHTNDGLYSIPSNLIFFKIEILIPKYLNT